MDHRPQAVQHVADLAGRGSPRHDLTLLFVLRVLQVPVGIFADALLLALQPDSMSVPVKVSSPVTQDQVAPTHVTVGYQLISNGHRIGWSRKQTRLAAPAVCEALNPKFSFV